MGSDPLEPPESIRGVKLYHTYYYRHLSDVLTIINSIIIIKFPRFQFCVYQIKNETMFINYFVQQ